MKLYQTESSDERTNAQRNLMGRTHYVDPDTLRFHKSRILLAQTLKGGLLFAIIESYAKDPDGRQRLYRPVLFDLFGTVIERVNIDEGFSTRAKAQKHLAATLATLDAKALTLEAIQKQSERSAREYEELATKVRAMETTQP